MSSGSGGAFRGSSQTFTTSPGWSFRPSSRHRLPLICTWRFSTNRRTADHGSPGRNCRSAATRARPACSRSDVIVFEIGGA